MITATPFQLNANAGTVLGFKPAKYGERVVRWNIGGNFVTVMIETTVTIKKGRREINRTSTRVDVYEHGTDGWFKANSAATEATEQVVSDFDCPDAMETRERDHWARLGGILKDGYRTPVR